MWPAFSTDQLERAGLIDLCIDVRFHLSLVSVCFHVLRDAVEPAVPSCRGIVGLEYELSPAVIDPEVVELPDAPAVHAYDVVNAIAVGREGSGNVDGGKRQDMDIVFTWQRGAHEIG